MKFDALDKKMRVYETAHDYRVPPEIYMVARIDGRGFTRLTKETHQLEIPFDERFQDTMVQTVKHLMNCGFHVLYGYTQSDEISLLFHIDEKLFGRKPRKFNSILAGEASAKFSCVFGDMASFDCRISELPNMSLVVDYFRWRNEDAFRNALNSHCYWMLRKKGESQKKATEFLSGKSVAFKTELLSENGIIFNDLPNWQKRGIGLYWESYEKLDEASGNTAQHKRIKVAYDLPLGEEYSAFIRGFLVKASN